MKLVFWPRFQACCTCILHFVYRWCFPFSKIRPNQSTSGIQYHKRENSTFSFAFFFLSLLAIFTCNQAECEKHDLSCFTKPPPFSDPLVFITVQAELFACSFLTLSLFYCVSYTVGTREHFNTAAEMLPPSPCSWRKHSVGFLSTDIGIIIFSIMSWNQWWTFSRLKLDRGEQLHVRDGSPPSNRDVLNRSQASGFRGANLPATAEFRWVNLMSASTLRTAWGRRDAVGDPPGKTHHHKSDVETELVSTCSLLWSTKKNKLYFLSFPGTCRYILTSEVLCANKAS